MKRLDYSALRINPFWVDRELFTAAADEVIAVLGERPRVADVIALLASLGAESPAFQELQWQCALRLVDVDVDAREREDGR